MLFMYRLRHLPTRINNQQEAIYFTIVSLGLNEIQSHPDLFNRIRTLLLSPVTAPKLRDNMVEFYLGLTPEYLGELYLKTYRDTGLTLFEFKCQIIRDITTLSLDRWVKHQILKLEIIEMVELWGLI